MLFENLHFFFDGVARDGPGQMALDEALLERVSAPILRVYRWAGPAVSFGYSQSLASVAHAYSPLPVVRRWTGGGIVEHGRDWTFSLVVPAGERLAKCRPSESYRLIHEVLAGLLASGVRLIGEGDVRPGASCFAAPALHDVATGDGRKLCGGAQRRTRRGLLHQGSIQAIALPEDFGPRAAAAFAKNTEVFVVGEDLPARAELLAATKYGSRRWREKVP